MAEPLHSQIRRLRQEKGMRLQDLAERAGIASSHLSLIERGLTDAKESSLGALAHGLDAEVLLVPRTHVSETLKLIGRPPAAANPSVGSTFEDVFIPDPDREDDHS